MKRRDFLKVSAVGAAASAVAAPAIAQSSPEIKWRIDRGEEIHGCGHVLERVRPASTVADAAILDVPRGPATTDEVAGECSHDRLAVALAPGATVDEDHHLMGTGPQGKAQLGALRAIRPVAVNLPASEKITDQAPRDHGPPS